MFILASASPRRKQLLKKIIQDFEIIVADVDERVLDSCVSPSMLALEESKLKAYSVYSLHPDDDVLAVDTIVLLNGKVLGKPKDEEDAFRMLKEQSGKKQEVISGYTYISKDREINRSVTTVVYFSSLSDEEIWNYIRKYKPLDKAGAYGIQDEAGLIEKIEGSYDNVMGLPTEDIKEHLFAKN